MQEETPNRFAEICFFTEGNAEKLKNLLAEAFLDDAKSGLKEFRAFIDNIDAVRLRDAAAIAEMMAPRESTITREFNNARNIMLGTEADYQRRVQEEADEKAATIPQPFKGPEGFPDDLDIFDPKVMFEAMDDFAFIDEFEKGLQIKKGLSAAFAGARDEIRDRINLYKTDILEEEQQYHARKAKTESIGASAKLLVDTCDVLERVCRQATNMAVTRGEVESAFILNGEARRLKESLDASRLNIVNIDRLKRSHEEMTRQLFTVLSASAPPDEYDTFLAKQPKPPSP